MPRVVCHISMTGCKAGQTAKISMHMWTKHPLTPYPSLVSVCTSSPHLEAIKFQCNEHAFRTYNDIGTLSKRKRAYIFFFNVSPNY